jgi:hypothetical protein
LDHCMQNDVIPTIKVHNASIIVHVVVDRLCPEVLVHPFVYLLL